MMRALWLELPNVMTCFTDFASPWSCTEKTFKRFSVISFFRLSTVSAAEPLVAILTTSPCSASAGKEMSMANKEKNKTRVRNRYCMIYGLTMVV
ncbi:MAG: hypothetical protein ABW140_03655, partial [Candidatus Sedimenticola sp. 6PFRAG1]